MKQTSSFSKLELYINFVSKLQKINHIVDVEGRKRITVWTFNW